VDLGKLCTKENKVQEFCVQEGNHKRTKGLKSGEGGKLIHEGYTRRNCEKHLFRSSERRPQVMGEGSHVDVRNVGEGEAIVKDAEEHVQKIP